MWFRLTELSLLFCRTWALRLCPWSLKMHGSGSALGEVGKALVACRYSKSDTHHCLLLGPVLCCSPACSELLHSFCNVTSWITPDVVFCVPLAKHFWVLQATDLAGYQPIPRWHTLNRPCSVGRDHCCLPKWSMQRAGVWCWAWLLCDRHKPMQDLRRKETVWGQYRKFRAQPDDVFQIATETGEVISGEKGILSRGKWACA